MYIPMTLELRLEAHLLVAIFVNSTGVRHGWVTVLAIVRIVVLVYVSTRSAGLVCFLMTSMKSRDHDFALRSFLVLVYVSTRSAGLVCFLKNFHRFCIAKSRSLDFIVLWNLKIMILHLQNLCFALQNLWKSMKSRNHDFALQNLWNVEIVHCDHFPRGGGSPCVMDDNLGVMHDRDVVRRGGRAGVDTLAVNIRFSLLQFSDSLSKTLFFLYLERGNAQDLQTSRCSAVGSSLRKMVTFVTWPSSRT